MCIVVHKLSMSKICYTVSDTFIVNHISWASCLTEPPQWGLNGLSNNHLLWLPRPNCIRMLLFLWYSLVHGGSNRIHSAKGLQTTMPRLSQYDRAHAIGTLDAGISARGVAAHLQVHESTISRLRRRLRDTGRTFWMNRLSIHPSIPFWMNISGWSISGFPFPSIHPSISGWTSEHSLVSKGQYAQPHAARMITQYLDVNGWVACPPPGDLEEADSVHAPAHPSVHHSTGRSHTVLICCNFMFMLFCGFHSL